MHKAKMETLHTKFCCACRRLEILANICRCARLLDRNSTLPLRLELTVSRGLALEVEM